MAREGAVVPDSFLFEGFRFDRGAGELFRLDQGDAAHPVPLGARATALLALLLDRSGRLVTKDEMMEVVWRGRIVEEANLTVQIAALRRLLDSGPQRRNIIQTVAGRGYRFVAPVTRLPLPLPASATEPAVGIEPSEAGLASTGERRGSPPPPRRLSAILAADVAGYSRLIGHDDEGTLVRLHDLRREVVDVMIATHRGRVVKTTGDGLLVEFASVVDAVRGAVALQRAVAQRNAGADVERRIEFRIGIDLGDIIVENDDIFGDGVNVAARLEAMAEPGGICISATVHDQIRDKLDFAFFDDGPQYFKNIARPVHVYRVRLDAGAAPPLPLPDKPSIAVLPFQNVSQDPNQQYFADGIVDEIITALSHIRWLFVIARNSSFTYKGQAVDVRRVGRELGVRYVLEGSVRRAQDRVRVLVQLIDAETGAHVWAGRFEDALDDVFAMQDKIALSVAGIIEPALHAAETQRSAARAPTDLSAYDLYLRALAIFSDGEVPHALTLLEQAITHDPRFAPALSWAANCCVRIMWDGTTDDPQAHARKGGDYARRALHLAGDDPTVLVHAALALTQLGEDIGAMIALVDRALALNPSFARGWYVSSNLRLFAGDIDGAVEHAQMAMRLSPLGRIGGVHKLFGAAEFFRGRFAEALPQLLLAVQDEPNDALAHRLLAACYAHMGRLPEAQQAIARLRQIAPLVVPSTVNWRDPAHRRLYLSGLRLAAGDPNEGGTPCDGAPDDRSCPVLS